MLASGPLKLSVLSISTNTQQGLLSVDVMSKVEDGNIPANMLKSSELVSLWYTRHDAETYHSTDDVKTSPTSLAYVLTAHRCGNYGASKPVSTNLITCNLSSRSSLTRIQAATKTNHRYLRLVVMLDISNQETLNAMFLAHLKYPDRVDQMDVPISGQPSQPTTGHAKWCVPRIEMKCASLDPFANLLLLPGLHPRVRPTKQEMSGHDFSLRPMSSP